MTFIEAVQTGLPFARKCWKKNFHGNISWVKKDEYSRFFVFLDSGNKWQPYQMDLTVDADDYFVKEEPKFLWAIKPDDKWEFSTEYLTKKEIEVLGYTVGIDAKKLEKYENS